MAPFTGRPVQWQGYHRGMFCAASHFTVALARSSTSFR